MCRDGLQRWFICRSKISRERTASIINREDWDLEIHDRKQTRRALSNTPRVLNLLAIAEPQGVDQELSCRELGSATRKQARPTRRNSEVEEQEFCKMCETYRNAAAELHPRTPVSYFSPWGINAPVSYTHLTLPTIYSV